MSKLGTIARSSLDMPDLDGREQAVLGHIADCQTERMGGNVLKCECGNREVHYNSCRDRHCPLCQGAARARWVQERLGELLPCPYFHVVFTVPHELALLALTNRRRFYRLLFAAVHHSLLTVCQNPENLGGRVGGLSILHTWNQRLAFHPHIHCIVPGGGLAPDGSRWISGNPNYLVSVRRLSAVFRGSLLHALEMACRNGQLYGDESTIRASLRKAAAKPFVVYAKPPFGGPAQVLKYLGRYTHRVGISEQRIVSADYRQVSFSWIDRAHGHTRNLMTLSTEAFIHKFLLHILPKGLRKIRYFGFMGNRDRTASMDRVRALIRNHNTSIESDCLDDQTIDDSLPLLAPAEPIRPVCPKCGRQMQLDQVIDSQCHLTCLRDRLAFLRQGLAPPIPAAMAGA